MAPSMQRNLLFNPEIENDLLKQLPQILPPLPPASLALLLRSQSHSDQPRKTSLNTPDELKALPPSSAVHQAAENKIFNSPLMDTIGAALGTGSVISSSVIWSSVAQKSATAVPVRSELFPAQGIRELQSSCKDNGMESLSAPWLVPNDCKALIRDSFLPTEGVIYLTKQAEFNTVAVTLLMFMGGAAFATAVQQGFMAAALTQTAEPVVKALQQTFHSATQPACLPPSLAGLETTATSIREKWDYEPPPDPGKIIEDLQDFFDVMGWGTKAALQAFDTSYKEGEEEENLRGVAATPQHEACFELLFPCANPVWVKNPTQPDMAVIQILTIQMGGRPVQSLVDTGADITVDIIAEKDCPPTWPVERLMLHIGVGGGEPAP